TGVVTGGVFQLPPSASEQAILPIWTLIPNYQDYTVSFRWKPVASGNGLDFYIYDGETAPHTVGTIAPYGIKTTLRCKPVGSSELRLEKRPGAVVLYSGAVGPFQFVPGGTYTVRAQII